MDGLVVCEWIGGVYTLQWARSWFEVNPGSRFNDYLARETRSVCPGLGTSQQGQTLVSVCVRVCG